MPPDTTTPTPSPALRGVACVDGKTIEVTTRDGLAEILRNPSAKVWVDVTAPEGSEVGEVATLLDLHPLISEDIAERNQRAKFEEIEGTIHIVMFAVAYEHSEVTTTEVDLVLGQRSLLTVHDELVFEAPPKDAPAIGEILKAEMESVYKLSVPLEVDIGIADNWADA